MNVLIRRTIAATVISTALGVSSFVLADDDDDVTKLVQQIKVELAQHTGIIGGVDEESGIVTLSGSTEDVAGFRAIVKRIESIEGVTEVLSSVTHSR